MRSKRWKRRNRHTRPELVRTCRVMDSFLYELRHYPDVYDDSMCMLNKYISELLLYNA